MAGETRIQELLDLERQGQLSPEQLDAVSALRRAGEFPSALPLASESATPISQEDRRRYALALPGTPEGARIRKAIEDKYGGRATFAQQFDPVGEFIGRKVIPTAIRLAPALITGNPLLAAGALAGGEAAAQFAESGEVTSPGEVGLAAAIPPGVATLTRAARSLGRGAIRLVPSLFQKAQAAGKAGAETVAKELAPTTAPSTLFAQARAATTESVPADKLIDVLSDLQAAIPRKPVTPSLQAVQAHMDNLRAGISQGQVNLGDLMRLRLDLGRSLTRGAAPELRALYKGVIGSLEAGATQGGAGASAAKEALALFKRDLGATRWRELVQDATKAAPLLGETVEALNVARLTNMVRKEAKELTGLVGPEGMKIIEAFLEKARTLPPTHAVNFANLVSSGLLGGLGLAGGGPSGLLVGLLGKELIQNFWAIGRNPATLNKVMTSLAQTARLMAGTTPATAAPPEGQTTGMTEEISAESELAQEAPILPAPPSQAEIMAAPPGTSVPVAPAESPRPPIAATPLGGEVPESRTIRETPPVALKEAAVPPQAAQTPAIEEAIQRVEAAAQRAQDAQERMEALARRAKEPPLEALTPEARPVLPEGAERTPTVTKVVPPGRPAEILPQPGKIAEPAPEAAAPETHATEAGLPSPERIPQTFREFVESKGRRWPVTVRDPGYRQLRQEFEALRRPRYERRGTHVVDTRIGEIMARATNGAAAQLLVNRLNLATIR